MGRLASDSGKSTTDGWLAVMTQVGRFSWQAGWRRPALAAGLALFVA